MQNVKHTHNKSGKAILGVLLLIIGGLLLLKNFGFYFPHWIFSWPMILIAIGLYTGSKNNFRNPGSFILLGIGGFFLIDNYISGFGMEDFIFPLILIACGLWVILRPKKKAENVNRQSWDWDKRVDTDATDQEAQPAASATYTGDDRVDSTSIFGGVKKNIVSKSFKGGEIVNIMGGAEINLIQADIQEPAILEVVQIFGGTKLIIPPHWIIQSEMAAIFGGIEDKRPIHAPSGEQQRILIIKGTSVFGGLSIASY